MVTTVRAPSRATDMSRLTIAALVLIGGALVLLNETFSTLDQPTSAVVWGSMALGTYAAGLLCLAGASHDAGLGLTRYKIGSWMLLWYIMAFGLATITWSRPQTTGVSAEIAISSVFRALWTVAMGITAWTVGYRVAHGRAITDLAVRPVVALRRRFSADVRNWLAPWTLYAIGIGASLTSAVASGRFGYLGNGVSTTSTAGGYTGLLGALTLCAPLGIMAAALQVFRQRLPSARPTLLILFAIQIVFGAAQGNKESFVVAVLAVAIPYSSAKGRMPKLALLLLVFIFVVVVIPFNQAYRMADHQGSPTPRQVVAGAPQIFRQAVADNSVFSLLPNSVDYLAQRIREIDNPAIIIQRTPRQVAFLNPLKLVVDPISGMIPRAIWAGKPVKATGLQVSQDFYELPPTTSSADTVIGGLYWYGGWLPVIIGMFLLGGGVRVMDDVLDVRSNPQASFLVLLLFPILVKGEVDWQAIVASLPATIAVWLFAVAITFRSRQRV